LQYSSPRSELDRSLFNSRVAWSPTAARYGPAEAPVALRRATTCQCRLARPIRDVVWRSERLGAASDSSSREGSALAWPTHHRLPDEVVHEVPSEQRSRHRRREGRVLHRHRLSDRSRSAADEQEDPVEQAYFPQSGMISLLAVMGDGQAIETATVGREGTVGAMSGFGPAHASSRAVVQVAGTAWVITTSQLRAVQERALFKDCLFQVGLKERRNLQVEAPPAGDSGRSARSDRSSHKISSARTGLLPAIQAPCWCTRTMDVSIICTAAS
jgi:CRP-like cAMP-binding protein